MKHIPIRVLCGVLLTALGIQLQARAQTNDNKLSQESLDKALCKAARAGDLGKVEQLLDQGADPKWADHKGHTVWTCRSAIFHAADSGNLEIARTLLKAGADPNLAVKNMFWPFASAISGGHVEMTRLLIEYGGNIGPFLADAGMSLEQWNSRDGPFNPEILEMLKQSQNVPPEVRRSRMRRRAAQAVAQASLLSKLPAIEAIEKKGDEALQAKRAQEALEHYIAAIKETPPGTDKDQSLREKAIKIVLAMKPVPAVAEEAKLHAERAQAFLKRAQDSAGYERVISELEQASLLAPWWAPVYYNLGSVREKAQDFEGALQSLKLYLLSAPHAQDAEAVRKKIIDLEVAQETEGTAPIALPAVTSPAGSEPPRRTP